MVARYPAIVRDRALNNSQPSSHYSKGDRHESTLERGRRVGCCLALICSSGQSSCLERACRDEEAVRAVNQAWFKAYAAGDVDGVVALYADDAVLSNPGVPPSRGQDAIREAYAKDIADSRTAGVSLNPNPYDRSGRIGRLAWEWGTFTATDKSGATVDNGKYLTVICKERRKMAHRPRYVEQRRANASGEIVKQSEFTGFRCSRVWRSECGKRAAHITFSIAEDP